MEFETEEIAHAFYNEYARRNGFGVRREYGNWSKKDGVLTSRLFTCHKEGKHGPDKRDYLVKEVRAETRTQCEAHMLISFKRKLGKHKVIDFVANHNHPLQPLKYSHMISSHRHISESQGSQIDIAYESGLSLKLSHEFMAKQAGGLDSLGYTKQDQKNYLRTKRRQLFKFGEVSALLMYFKRKANEEPFFFYDFQMDVEDEITNIFWADAQMINDYGYFGDVITFDTTYKTNKDYRPLGVFVGLNNHRQTVTFGAALLYDKTIPSFD